MIGSSAESVSDHRCSFLQDDSVVPEDSNGFKQYDSKDATGHTKCSSHSKVYSITM